MNSTVQERYKLYLDSPMFSYILGLTDGRMIDEYHSMKSIEVCTGLFQQFGALLGEDTVVLARREWTGVNDKNGKPIFVGDIFMYTGGLLGLPIRYLVVGNQDFKKLDAMRKGIVKLGNRYMSEHLLTEGLVTIGEA